MPPRTGKGPKKWGMYEGTGERAADKKVAQLQETVRQIRSGEVRVTGCSRAASIKRLTDRIEGIRAGTRR